MSLHDKLTQIQKSLSNDDLTVSDLEVNDAENIMNSMEFALDSSEFINKLATGNVHALITKYLDLYCQTKTGAKKEAKRCASVLKKSEKNKNSTSQTKSKEEDHHTPESYILQRQDDTQKLKDKGISDHPHHFPIDITLQQFREKYNEIETGTRLNDIKCRIAGRIMLKRNSGSKLYFYTIQERTTTLQIMSDLNSYTNEKIDFFTIHNVIKRGDYVGIIGYPAKSKKGELSIIPYELHLLTPCYRLLPKNRTDEKGEILSGLVDPEIRFRNRSLDMIINHKVQETFYLRAQVVKEIRSYLDKLDFVEVETPILSTTYGGATASPFMTHCNAYDLPMAMRIAPELYLKKLVIGGMTRVYEIGKQFRNEACDMTHNCEFTSLEFYMAHQDYNGLMLMAEELLSGIVKKVKGNMVLPLFDKNKNETLKIDYTPPYRKIDFLPELEKCIREKIPAFKMPNDLNSIESNSYLSDTCLILQIECPFPRTTARLLDKLAGAFLEPQCVNPTFIINHPQIMSPLAKYHRTEKQVAERFELFINGIELMNAYTELNNYQIQDEMMREQIKDREAGDEETPLPDEDYIEAMRYGLPPTGGFGMGVDRLIQFLTNQPTIREVILFPVMKPI